MKTREKGIDWLRVIVHGVCGLLFGVALGFAVWVFVVPDAGALPVVCIPGIVVALLAAAFGDRFWESLKHTGWWDPR
ncbi:MAG: hypothetical protein ACYTDY_05840 [Planctomycetota bacterium]|jgi:hypothetical protein